MQNLLSSFPADPSPIAALTLPVAAPAAPGPGGSDQPFRMVLAELNPPTLVPAGQGAPAPGNGAPLPFERPKLAGPLPPETPIEEPAAVPAEIFPVETVMVGAKPLLPVVSGPVQPQAPTPASANIPAPTAPNRLEADSEAPQIETPPPVVAQQAAAFPIKRPWVLRVSSALTPPAPLAAATTAATVVEPQTADRPPAAHPIAPLSPMVSNDPAPAVIEDEAEGGLPAPPPEATLQPMPTVAFDPAVWIAPAPISAEASPVESAAAEPNMAPVVVFPRASASTAPPAIEARPAESLPPQDMSPVDPALPPVAAPMARPGSEPAIAAAQPGFAPELLRQVARLIQPAAEAPSAAIAAAPVEALAAAAPSAASTQPTIMGPTVAPAPQPVALQPQPAPIDLGRAEWMQAMIERIAEMPQVDGRREAQIRLLPDMLGAIEVKIVEREERLHVTLNADSAQARQLLSEHAPRLAELAEARGLRFAQTDIGGGQSQDRRHAAEQQPQTPSRPRSAAAGPDAEPQPDGERIA